MSFDVDVSALVTLSFDLQKAGSKVQEQAGQAVRKTAFAIQASAKEKAPVDTGNLRSGIAVSTGSQYDAEVYAQANYAKFVELGTSRMAPQPFMRPAADEHEPGFISAMQEITGRIL